MKTEFKPDMVKLWIKRRKLLVGYVAKQLGLTSVEMSHILNGSRKVPVGFYEKVESIIGVPKDKFK